MKTRVGKIAQLPKQIRHELNQRLENGNQSPELLRWLNALPETKELLTAKFAGQPITRSNLSDWRVGGYQDWLRLQAREERIQRLTESGDSLKQFEGNSDLFENFARLVIAELADDLETLDTAKNPEERRQRLREICRDLARLQNGYNRSRWAELAWTKYNDLSPQDAESDEPIESDEPESPPLAPDPTITNTQNATRNTSPPVVPNRAASHSRDPHYVHRAPCGCVCRKCHSEDGPYPYWEAERDLAATIKSGTPIVEAADGRLSHLLDWNCDCTCQRCDSKNRPEPEGSARKSVFRTIHNTRCHCRGTCKKCHAPDSEYPMTEVSRDIREIHETHRSILRRENGLSICVRSSFCNCTCDECENAENEDLLPNTGGLPPELPPTV
jgi:hypothetical protein